MSEILSGAKTVLIPVIVGLMTYPLLQILQYKGIIIKDPTLSSNQKLVYPMSVTSDSLNSVIVTFNVVDTKKCIIGNERMIVSPLPKDINWTNTSIHQFGNDDSATKSIMIKKMRKGKYNLEIPLSFKTNETNFINGQTGNLVFSLKKNSSSLPEPFTDIKFYQWYFWIFFNPWLTSLGLCTISLLIMMVTKTKKL